MDLIEPHINPNLVVPVNKIKVENEENENSIKFVIEKSVEKINFYHCQIKGKMLSTEYLGIKKLEKLD